jgi:hypothetical protein
MKNFVILSFLLFFMIIPNIFLPAQELTGIEVRTQVSGVSVYVNDTFRGKTADVMGMFNMLRIEGLSPGTYRVRCEFEDYQPMVEDVVVERNKIRLLEVQFARSRVRAESISDQRATQVMRTGSVTVRSIPTGAYVTIDGGTRTTTDSVYHDVSVGEHLIDVYFDRNDPDKHLSITVNVVADKTVTVIADFLTRKISHDGKYTVSFISDPPGKLFLDDESIGTVPQTLELQGGEYRVRIEKEGYENYSADITVTGNDLLRVSLAKIEHSLEVRTVPEGTRLSLTDSAGRVQSIGHSPATIKIDPGEYTVHAQMAGYSSQSKKVTVKADHAQHFCSFVLEPSMAYIEVSRDSSYPGEQHVKLGDLSLGNAPIMVSPVPAGKQILTIGSLRTNIELQQGFHYRIEPSIPFPEMKPVASADELPDAPALPLKPELLPETKQVKRQDVKTGLLWGGALGALGGLTIAVGMGEDADGAVYLFGPLVTGALGAFYGALMAPSRNVTVPDEENILENRLAMVQWEKEVRVAEEERRSIMEQENKRRSEYNSLLAERNEGRGTIAVSDSGVFQQKMLYHETFLQGRGGWYIGENDDREWLIFKDAYRGINRSTGNIFSTRVSADVIDETRDFELEVVLGRFEGKENSGYGFFWGASSDWGERPVAVLLNGNGRFFVGRLVNNQWVRIIDWKVDPAVRKQGFNHVFVRRRGPKYHLTINGKEVASWAYTPLDGPFLGMMVGPGLVFDVDMVTLRQYPR